MKPEEYVLLVVDDNEENRDVLSRRLIKKGFQVLVAEGGRQALAVIEAQTDDLVLLDIMMPGMTGIEVLEELRKTRSAPSCDHHVHGNDRRVEDVVQALELGANDYVTKPIDSPWCSRACSRSCGSRSRRRRRRRPSRRGFEGIWPAPRRGPAASWRGAIGSSRAYGSGAFGTVYRAIHSSSTARWR